LENEQKLSNDAEIIDQEKGQKPPLSSKDEFAYRAG
jgi:hypothetical protein